MGRLTEKFVCNLPDKVLEALGVADVPREEWQIKGTHGNLCSETCKKHQCSDCPIQNAIDKLAEYEDAEEKGLLLQLPCNVGDTVYEIQPLTKRITERLIKSIVVCNAPNLTIMYKSGYDYTILHEDFCKTVFLTKEEAEQALEAMKEGAV